MLVKQDGEINRDLVSDPVYPTLNLNTQAVVGTVENGGSILSDTCRL